MSNQVELRRQITNQIIEALERDEIPWRRPWNNMTNTGRPMNAISKKHYNGVNPLILALHAHRHGFQSRYWATFPQWQSLRGQVRKRPDHIEPGKWGCQIVFFRAVRKDVKDSDSGEDKIDRFLVMKAYTVFNADQVDGVERFQARIESPSEWNDFGPAEHLIAASGAKIEHRGNDAYYTRPIPEGSFPNHAAGDHIVVPLREQFVSQAAYYETTLHELAHWTEVRTGWDHKKQGYEMGELAAEIACCYLSTELGIQQTEDLENHARYIKSWLAAMKNDPKFIFTASTQASKASDLLLSFVPVTNIEADSTEEAA